MIKCSWLTKINAMSHTMDRTNDSKEKLEKFNGKAQNWDNSNRALVAHLNLMKNEDGVPLYYVIIDLSVKGQYQRDIGVIGSKIYDAVTMGEKYQNDSFNALNILRE